MIIEIKGTAKEIADLALALRGRQVGQSVSIYPPVDGIISGNDLRRFEAFMRDSAVHGGGGINNSGRRSTTQGITTEKLYQEKRKEVYRELKEFSEQATHPCMHCEQKEKCCEAWRKADEHPDDLLICERFCDWLRDRERIYGKLDVIQYIEAEGRVKNGGGGRGEL